MSTESSTLVAHVRVTVLQLTGILCELVPSKRKTKGDFFFDEDVVVSAVASFSRNSIDSNTNLLTHIPSLPVGGIFNVRNRRNRHKANWPANDSMRDDDDINHSSFSFSRVLKREKQRSSNFAGVKNEFDAEGVDFEPELVDISVGLIQGGEMIPLGCTTLAISGPKETTADLIVRNETLPARLDPTKRSLRSATGSSLKNGSKKIKYATFQNNPYRRYKIAENATLSVQIQVSLSNLNKPFYARNCPTYQPRYDVDHEYNGCREALTNNWSPNMQIRTHQMRPDLNVKVNNECNDFQDVSTISESTKSGYIVSSRFDNTTLNSAERMRIHLGMCSEESPVASEESPVAVADYKHQIFGLKESLKPGKKTEPTSPSNQKSSFFFDMICCIPDMMGSYDDCNDHPEESLPQKQPLVVERIMSHKMQAESKNDSLPKNVLLATNNDAEFKPTLPGEESQNPDQVYYFTPESERMFSGKTVPSVTADTVNSIERATQTLHHYANRFGLTAEELL